MSGTTEKPIVITAGDPAGIGPDLCVMLAQNARKLPLIVIADPQLITDRAEQLGLPVKLVEYRKDGAVSHDAGELTVLPEKMVEPAVTGKLNAANAPYVLATLRRAVQGCMEQEFAALVTGPVHKGIINDAGIPFTGHTEFLAELTATDEVVMMLATEGLRVALVTTHLPLSEVSQAITPEHLERIISILHHDFQTRFGLPDPRILVCGLNPHAGEGGHLGREEIEIIEPVLEKLRRQGMNLIGPLPADTAFVPRQLEQADAVLAMYHDQGLPVLKHLGFSKAVNVTLGLPIIRTSVDHGTALDLAGTGKATLGSMHFAIETAASMIND